MVSLAFCWALFDFGGFLVEDLDVDLVPDMALSVELEDRSFDFDDLEYCSLCALDLKEEEVVESVLDLDGLEGDNFYDVDLFCK